LQLQFGIILLPSIRLSVFFPEDLNDPPFCFVESSAADANFIDAASDVCEAANQLLQPLSRGSLLLVLSVLQKAANAQRERLWPSFFAAAPAGMAEGPATASSSSSLGPCLFAPAWARAHTAAAVAQRVFEDRFACEVTLAFFSIALSSPRRDTVCDPMPFTGTLLPLPSNCPKTASPSSPSSSSSPLPRSPSSAQPKRSFQSGCVDDELAAHLLGLLDGLPPLKALATAEAANELATPALALLAAVLVASPVRLRTVQAPGQPPHCTSASSRSNGPGRRVVAGGLVGGDSENGNFVERAATTTTRAAVADSAADSETKETGVAASWAEVEVLGRTPNWSFESLKAAHGSREGYHGSAPANWWCISHKGLKNRSHTKHQRNGAVFGEGVYLATDVRVSRTFAVSRGSGERPLLHLPCPLALTAGGDNHGRDRAAASGEALSEGLVRPEFPFECVARCEVIDLKSNVAPRVGVNKGGSSSSSSSSDDGGGNDCDYLVVSDEAQVHLRSILLFPTGRLKPATSTTRIRTQQAASEDVATVKKTSPSSEHGFLHQKEKRGIRVCQRESPRRRRQEVATEHRDVEMHNDSGMDSTWITGKSLRILFIVATCFLVFSFVPNSRFSAAALMVFGVCFLLHRC